MRIGFSGELASAAAVLAAAAMLMSAMRATTEAPSVPDSAAAPFAAFITLDENGEEEAVRAARSSWRAPSGAAIAHGRARLAYDELPPAREPEAIGDAARTRAERPADIGWIPPPWPSGLPAPPPVNDVQKTEATLPFPREDLLKLP